MWQHIEKYKNTTIDGYRTLDLGIGAPVLYPTELRAGVGSLAVFYLYSLPGTGVIPIVYG